MLTLCVPGLLERDAAPFAALRAARALGRYAEAPTLEARGLGAATCVALGLPGETPLAPLCALGADLSIGDEYVVAATPVTLVADRDLVVLAGRVADLRDDESGALIARLNDHFAEDGVSFAAARPAAWFAHAERSFDLSTTPLDAALGRPIAGFLPRGRDGKTWQRWQVEIQMIFHEHAINDERAALGLPPVSGVWLSGNGRLRDIVESALTNVFAGGDEAGDLARGFARRVGLSADALPDAHGAILAGAPREAHTLVAMNAITNPAEVERFGTKWLEPAVDALEAGMLDALQLVADGHGAAVVWRAKHPSALARAASRFTHRALAIPKAQDR